MKVIKNKLENEKQVNEISSPNKLFEEAEKEVKKAIENNEVIKEEIIKEEKNNEYDTELKSFDYYSSLSKKELYKEYKKLIELRRYRLKSFLAARDLAKKIRKTLFKVKK